MRRWYHTRSKIMPCSHIMKNCWYVVLLCVPVDQNHSACVSCCRRSSAPCTTIQRGSCSVTGKHRRRCGKDSYPPLMSQRACGFPRTRKPTSPSGRNTPRRYMRRCLRLEGSSGAPVNEYAFYRSQQGVPVWLPDEADDASPISDEEEADEVEASEQMLLSAPSTAPLTDRRDYDSEHYLRILRASYAERLL